jgi:hypothetical protein
VGFDLAADAEHRVEEVGVEVEDGLAGLGCGQVTGARVEAQNRLVEAGVEQAREVGKLHLGRLADEHPKGSAAQTGDLAAGLRQEGEIGVWQAADQALGPLIARIEQEARFGAVTADHLVDPGAELLAQLRQTGVAEERILTAQRDLPLGQRLMLGRLPLAAYPLHLGSVGGRKGKPTSHLLSDAGAD